MRITRFGKAKRLAQRLSDKVLKQVSQKKGAKPLFGFLKGATCKLTNQPTTNGAMQQQEFGVFLTLRPGTSTAELPRPVAGCGMGAAKDKTATDISSPSFKLNCTLQYFD